MQRVLIVGGAGYIGGYTTDLLKREGYDVAVYDSLLYEDRYLKNIPFIYGDIRDTNKLIEVADQYDCIVLAAALVGDPACSVDNLLTEEVNYSAIRRFTERISSDKRLIFLSTCSVYGAQDGVLTEQSPTNPLSTYASTKLRAEQHILDKGGVVFRLGTVFGLGDTYSRIRLDLVVNVLTLKAVKEGKITVSGGDQWRPIIAVRDIAQYISEAVNNKVAGIFNLSYKNTTIRELGDEVCNLILGTQIEYTPMSFQDARNYRVSTEAVDKAFQYRPIASVKSEVIKMSKLFQENRIKDDSSFLYNNGKFIQSLKNNNGL